MSRDNNINSYIESDEYEMETSSETALLVNRDSDSSDMENSQIKYTVEKDGVEVTDSEDNKNTEQKQPSTVFLYTLSFFAAIGGFLFGYDTGVVSGAMLLLKDQFHLSSFLEELIVSSTILFAAIFALIGGVLNNAFGRKFVTILASLVFTGGAILLGVAQNVAMLIAGRSILGIGIGLASMTVPIYIAECAPPHLRGRLVTINNLFITGGQFIASILDGAFSYDKVNGWRWMLGLAGVPSAIQFVGFLFLPESPRWLIQNGKSDQARKVLQSIRGSPDVSTEIKSIEQSCREDRERDEESGNSIVLLKILKTPAVRRAVIVGCGLQLFQQLSGINTVMYYSASIVKMTGIRDESTAIWIAAGTAGVNFVFTIVGVYLVERIGRRPLILGSLIGVLLSLGVLAIGFQLTADNSPPINIHEMISNETDCYSYSFCEDCIENLKCGFCYQEIDKLSVNGSCLPVMDDHSGMSSVGRCNASSPLPDDLIWAYQYCPSKYSWMGIAGLVLYLVFFAPGMGPMPWTINSEIYPLWARSTATSLATATNWIFNLLVSMSFLTLTETITKHGTYWLFVGIVFLGILFIFFTLPETKGKRLEEVEDLFDRNLCIKCSSSESSAKISSTSSR